MTTVEQLRAAVGDVRDPEIPVISIEDLGVLRDVSLEGERVVVTITPTYSGCPALREIAADVESAVRACGHEQVEVRTVLSPAWTTDWMSEQGRRRLSDYGIAPPQPRTTGPVPVAIGRPLALRCPQCGSSETEELTRFGSTSCKSMWRCLSCREPFDHFKTH